MWIRTQAGAAINLDFVERMVIRRDRELPHENAPYIVEAHTNGGLTDVIACFATLAEADRFLDNVVRRQCGRHDSMRNAEFVMRNLKSEAEQYDRHD